MDTFVSVSTNVPSVTGPGHVPRNLKERCTVTCPPLPVILNTDINTVSNHLFFGAALSYAWFTHSALEPEVPKSFPQCAAKLTSI